MYEFTCCECGEVFHVDNQDEIFHCWRCGLPMCFDCYYSGDGGLCVECNYEIIPKEQK